MNISSSLTPIPTPPSQSDFVQNPPYPIGFWVKKLTTPTKKGENLIFKVQFESDFAMNPKIDYFHNGSVAYILMDDGIYPDDVAGDKKFACLKKENLSDLKAEIAALENNIQTQGNVVHFTGHSGEIILASDITPFNVGAFDRGLEVEVKSLLIDAVNCATEIKLEKSLFITDLSVVEDQSRTYNVYTGVGNPSGVWTFSALMANMENGTHADGVRGFLKDWIKTWTQNQTVNGQIVKSRDFVLQTFITPWLRKANNNPSLPVTLQNWEATWNATNELALKNNAPFKLTAIVNRLDLRGNSAYTSSLANTGETRFIYTLVNPLTGEIPINPNQTASQEQNGIGFFDWMGLNVILEYGNVQQSNCQAQQLAQLWLDLSDESLPLGTATTNNGYKDNLQIITDMVTQANSKPEKPNGSAINRIRTNEKLFATFDTQLETHLAWDLQDWEFRQFEINTSSNIFELVPLTNNPPVTANFAPNIEEDYTTSNPSITNNSIIDWIYSGHKHQVKNGNFNLPSNLLAVSGIVRSEGAQFFGLDASYQVTKSVNYSVSESSLEAKQIRQQLSLNTCVGCHAGETKTRFTQMNTLKYGQTANYFSAMISGIIGTQDDAFYPWGGNDPLQLGGENNGLTIDPISGSIKNFTVTAEIKHQNFFQNVSPFLTGRRYRTYTNTQAGVPNWQDDELDVSENLNNNGFLADDKITGLFYVNDPSNNNDANFPYLDDKKWGYNDLLNRKNKLCQFLNTSCSGNPTSITMMKNLSFIPLPVASR